MANPLDNFVGKARPKLVVKIPAIPKLTDAIRNPQLMEDWRRGFEKALERITPATTLADAVADVTNVTNIITPTPPPPTGDFATVAALNSEAATRAAADANLQTQIDAIEQVRYATMAKYGF